MPLARRCIVIRPLTLRIVLCVALGVLALTEFMSEKRNNGNFPLKKVASGGRNTYTEFYKNLVGLKGNWNMFVYIFEQIRFAKNPNYQIPRNDPLAQKKRKKMLRFEGNIAEKVISLLFSGLCCIP